MNQELFDRFVKSVVSILFVEPDKVTMDASFIKDLGADSLAMVELVMVLEEEFNIEVPESDLGNIITVAKAYELVLSKIK
jgi:acyl carrier protein